MPFGVGRGSDADDEEPVNGCSVGLHCLSALVVVPTSTFQGNSFFKDELSSLPFGVGRGSDSYWTTMETLWITRVFIAFRRWSWFRRTQGNMLFRNPSTRSSLPFGVGRGSDIDEAIKSEDLDRSVFIAFRRWSWFRQQEWFTCLIARKSVFIAFRRWSWFRHETKSIKLLTVLSVFIAFRRWSWFRRPNRDRKIRNERNQSSLPFGVGRGSDVM